MFRISKVKLALLKLEYLLDTVKSYFSMFGSGPTSGTWFLLNRWDCVFGLGLGLNILCDDSSITTVEIFYSS